MKGMDVIIFTKHLVGFSAETICEGASSGCAALSVWVNKGVC